MWRLFKDQDVGTYIDVGANDPLNNSVSRIFYEQGWHVEPVRHFYDQHCDLRPLSDNFPFAVSSEERVGSQSFYQFGNDGLSSLRQPTSLIQPGVMAHLSEVKVEVITLKTIIESLALSSIDFIKMDIEGEEFNALQGLDLGHLGNCELPKVMIFEMAQQNSSIASQRD